MTEIVKNERLSEIQRKADIERAKRQLTPPQPAATFPRRERNLSGSAI